MFGTIGHARLKPGHAQHQQELMEQWKQEIRPLIPGSFLSLAGHVEDKPEEIVFVALAQDRDTYRQLAALPEQDSWFRRFLDHVDGDVRWEDVELDVVLHD